MPNGRHLRSLVSCIALVLASGSALAQNAFDAGASLGNLKDLHSKAVTITPGATTFGACVKAENGQLRIADERGCNPSELPISLAAGNVTPLEVSRLLTIPAGSGGIYSGIFGGLVCPGGRTLVSGGYQILRSDVKVQESFIGPGFGLPRVYIVASWTFTYGVLPEGDVIKMWATCL
jgi:hypothetical protein